MEENGRREEEGMRKNGEKQDKTSGRDITEITARWNEREGEEGVSVRGEGEEGRK